MAKRLSAAGKARATAHLASTSISGGALLLGSIASRLYFLVHFRVVDLANLLKRPEGKTLEFKRDLSSSKGVLRTVVAFANTSGGVLLIGIEDGTRHVRGVDAPLDAEEQLANVIADGVLPRLVPELEILPWRRTHSSAWKCIPVRAARIT